MPDSKEISLTEYSASASGQNRIFAYYFFTEMRDVIWTIIVVWVIYRIYEAIKSSRVFIYQRHEHNHNYNTQKEGEVKIDSKQETSHHTDRKPNSDKGGEYVDFEEVKD